MTETEWKQVKAGEVPENIIIETKIQGREGDRNVQKMKFSRNLWWISDDMYAYYRPTHWRYLPGASTFQK